MRKHILEWAVVYLIVWFFFVGVGSILRHYLYFPSMSFEWFLGSTAIGVAIGYLLIAWKYLGQVVRSLRGID